MYDSYQLDLFGEQNLNIVAEVKRQIRLALGKTTLSRDEVVDRMNALASRDGLKDTVSKATLDGWCKDSDTSRIPSLARLVLFCHVLGTADPIRAVARPLGTEVVGPEERKILAWGKAELARRRAAKKARLALEVLEADGD
jgi:hypothetical protein